MATMKRLQVYLLIQHWPGFSPPYLVFLQRLHQMIRFKLTVLNNGQPFHAKPLLNQAGLTCRVVQYPLRFHPAQILADCLQSAPAAEAYFWFEDHLLWHPAILMEWLKQLEKWTWIGPNLLPAEAQPQSLRIYQAQALNPASEVPRLMSAHLDTFPPALLFSQAAITTLKEWLRPEGQLPLLMLAACDANSNAWHPQPSLEPTRADLALTLSEAQERWAKIQAKNCPLSRQRVLLESLQRAFPDSPYVYLALAPLLTADFALILLETALQRRLIYPEVLNALTQVLLACGQNEAAQAVKFFLKSRFPSYKKQHHFWESVSQSKPFDTSLLRQDTLSLCIVLKENLTDSQSLLEQVQAFAELDCEILILHAELAANRAQELAEAGCVLIQSSQLLPNTEAYNQLIEQANGDWILILNAFESVSTTIVSSLQQVLACPIPGLPRFQIQVHHIFADGRETLIQPEIRLFPRHPLLRYQGSEFPRLTCRLSSPTPVLNEAQIYKLVPLLTGPHKKRLALEQSLYKTAYPKSPEQPVLALILGKQALEMGDLDAACEWFGKTLTNELNPGYNDAFLALMSVCLQAQSYLPILQKQVNQVSQALLDHPDYWYLKGHHALISKHYPEAYQAFENCLAYRGSEALLKLAYHPDYIFPGAVIALLDLDRYRMLAPQSDLRQREQAARKMLQRCLQLLVLYPDGQWLKSRLNLFYYLGEAIVFCARFQLDTQALHLFLESLPVVYLQNDMAYYTETAFIYLDTQSRLAERLPPDYDESTLQTLSREPQRLHAFCQELWQRSEFDGHLIADKLLFFTAIARQEAELAMLLADLHPLEYGLQILKMLKPHFENNPYYLYFYAKKVHAASLKIEAQILLQACLAIKPDYTEALSLSNQLQKEVSNGKN